MSAASPAPTPGPAAISGWSSWVTACSDSRSRRCSMPNFPTRGGRTVPPARRSRAPGELRRGGGRLGCRAVHPARRRARRRPAGAGRQAILGDVCEALIGAVFLDGGFEAAAARGAARLDALACWRRGAPLQDPKTALQEWAQARGKPTPVYSETERSGPRPCAAVHRRRDGRGLRARRRAGTLQAARRTGRRRELHAPRGFGRSPRRDRRRRTAT